MRKASLEAGEPIDLPVASLARLERYPVPHAARLEFRFTRDTTDGFARGDVSVVFEDGRPPRTIATQVPAMGDGKRARVLGDYAHLFPEPLPVAR